MKDSEMVLKGDSAYSVHAYQALKIGFVVAPLAAGIDKFFNYLTDWPKYLAPFVPDLLGVAPQTFMRGVGVIEIVAGIGVILKPRIFAYVVSAWLVGIVINLLIQGQYLDVALRDVGLAIGAFALGQLATKFDHAHIGENQRSTFKHHGTPVTGRV